MAQQFEKTLLRQVHQLAIGQRLNLEVPRVARHQFIKTKHVATLQLAHKVLTPRSLGQHFAGPRQRDFLRDAELRRRRKFTLPDEVCVVARKVARRVDDFISWVELLQEFVGHFFYCVLGKRE